MIENVVWAYVKGLLATRLGVQAFLFLVLVVLVNMPETQIALYGLEGGTDVSTFLR